MFKNIVVATLGLSWCSLAMRSPVTHVEFTSGMRVQIHFQNFIVSQNLRAYNGQEGTLDKIDEGRSTEEKIMWRMKIGGEPKIISAKYFKPLFTDGMEVEIVGLTKNQRFNGRKGILQHIVKLNPRTWLIALPRNGKSPTTGPILEEKLKYLTQNDARRTPAKNPTPAFADTHDTTRAKSPKKRDVTCTVSTEGCDPNR